ncbi:helix-turn-helix domain-containing protein [Parasphingorhabdus sp.]|uniref:MarR family winged helix-turn-helix transcriptional regulator n=1 Tax=Parasphingorhabdus sp. TaxID=2709688 RepID=UPI0032669634
MKNDVLVVQLVEALYWFDKALQQRLRVKGWKAVSPRQSMILANIADGEVRPSAIASKLGISRQAMSQALSEMVDRGIVVLTDDPNDRRAKIICLTKEMEPMHHDTIEILGDLENILEEKLGKTRFKSFREALAINWRALPFE